jgi:hypothetical protein
MRLRHSLGPYERIQQVADLRHGLTGTHAQSTMVATAFFCTCSCSVSLGQLVHRAPQLPLHPRKRHDAHDGAPPCEVHAARQGSSLGHLVLVVKPACM